MLSLMKVTEEGAERGEAARRLWFPSAAQAARRNGEGRAQRGGEGRRAAAHSVARGGRALNSWHCAAGAWPELLRLRLAATALLRCSARGERPTPREPADRARRRRGAQDITGIAINPKGARSDSEAGDAPNGALAQ